MRNNAKKEKSNLMRSAKKNIRFFYSCFSTLSRDSRVIFLLVSAFFILPSAFLWAQSPAWWYSRGVIGTNSQANDYAPLTQGQLKWIATNAFNEMEVCFGAGTSVASVVSGFSNANNFRLSNRGHLKYVVQPFYDRLYEMNLTNTFPANMPGYYPWGNAAQTNDYAIANIGQAKYVFSFDSAKDSDGDGISDWQEAEYGTNPYNPDSDGDGLSDSYELAHNTDPLDADDCDQEALTSQVEEARQRIIQHWLLFYGSAPAFTNTPGSAADLIDLRDALNALSEKFYNVQ